MPSLVTILRGQFAEGFSGTYWKFEFPVSHRPRPIAMGMRQPTRGMHACLIGLLPLLLGSLLYPRLGRTCRRLQEGGHTEHKGSGTIPARQTWQGAMKWPRPPQAHTLGALGLRGAPAPLSGDGACWRSASSLSSCPRFMKKPLKPWYFVRRRSDSNILIASESSMKSSM